MYKATMTIDARTLRTIMETPIPGTSITVQTWHLQGKFESFLESVIIGDLTIPVSLTVLHAGDPLRYSEQPAELMELGGLEKLIPLVESHEHFSKTRLEEIHAEQVNSLSRLALCAAAIHGEHLKALGYAY